MPVRVLIVDDSVFSRYRLKMMLESDPRLEVVGEATNGVEAVEMASRLEPDIITMDVEMPVLDGISATRRIMESSPCPILIFSSLVGEGAQITLDALDAGAVDYLPKRFEDISRNREEATRALCDRVYALSRGHGHLPSRLPESCQDVATGECHKSGAGRTRFKLLAIGASTGGPMAIQDLLTRLPGAFPMPIIVVQHMPGPYTRAFAERLNHLSNIRVKEAEEGERLQAGIAYLAPGDKQLLLEARSGGPLLRVVEAQPGQIYKPSVDITFNTIASVYPGHTLALILSGMGSDGLEGVRSLKQAGAEVWTQDEASCVVYGMPAAVAEAGLSNRVLPLTEILPALLRL